MLVEDDQSFTVSHGMPCDAGVRTRVLMVQEGASLILASEWTCQIWCRSLLETTSSGGENTMPIMGLREPVIQSLTEKSRLMIDLN